MSVSSEEINSEDEQECEEQEDENEELPTFRPKKYRKK